MGFLLFIRKTYPKNGCVFSVSLTQPYLGGWERGCVTQTPGALLVFISNGLLQHIALVDERSIHNFNGIFPYIGLIYGRYLQFRILKWPRQLLYIYRYHRGSTHCFPLNSTMPHHASPWKPPCQERYESLKARRGAGEAVDPGVLPVISYSFLRRKWSFYRLDDLDLPWCTS